MLMSQKVIDPPSLKLRRGERDSKKVIDPPSLKLRRGERDSRCWHMGKPR